MKHFDHPIPEWTGEIGLVGVALGRLSKALGGPMTAAWAFRARAEAAAAIVGALGHKVDPLRLQAWISGLPLRPSRDFGATNTALRVLDRLRDAGGDAEDPEGAQDRLAVARALAAMDRAAALPGHGPILGCAVGFLRHLHEEGDRTAACIAVGHWFNRVGLLPVHAPALTGATLFRNWSATDSLDQRISWFLKGMIREAQAAENDLVALHHRWRGWRRRLGPQRQDSRLIRTLDFVTARGVVGPATVARYLRVRTSLGTDMLEGLAGHGCVVEVTRRRNYRIFVAEDLSGMADQIAPGSGALKGDRVGGPADGIPWAQGSGMNLGEESGAGQPPQIDLDRAMSDLDEILARTRMIGAGFDAGEADA